jgi:MurNAc alpha-1-phosphate uridylyltransferase
MTAQPDKNPAGMVLAAGHGTRMRPLTLTCPKPLIDVAGKPLLEHACNQLRSIDASPIVVNAHYLGEQIFEWSRKPENADILVSDETAMLLDTGGGVAKARDLLGDAPFFVFNSDAFWIDRPGHSTIKAMQARYDPARYDFLLLLSPHENAVGFDGKGDFFCDNDNRLTRRGSAETAPYIYAGCYLVHPRVFADCPSGAFSMNILWNRAIEQKRLSGIVLDGLWLHVGTPPAINEAETAIKQFTKQTDTSQL